jgi:hypothetical protein
MKKIIVSTLMLVFATSAFASESAYVLEPLMIGRGEYAEPCPQNPDAPTPANGYCYPGRECPVGYDAVPKFCWNGGLHRCGIACSSNGMYDN